MKSTVICRFAPSPTGPLHVGGARSALFNYLFARQNKGKLILRIEDTDRERSKKEYAEDIIESFKWLGIEFDETYTQSAYSGKHKKYLSKLIESKAAYLSKEKEIKEGGRKEVIRFRNPNKKVAFDDLIKGHIEFDTTELGDFVIAKSLEEPLFHLAVVADDFDMGVTHVIRGEDHISNTPRQILIQEALGAPRPIYAHIPLILESDRSKLSKRKHGEAVSMKFYREHGYMPEALINYLALLGWNPGDEREVFTLPELVKEFRLEKVQKAGAIFNLEKLKWLNKEYLMKDPSTLTAQIIAILDREARFKTLQKSGRAVLADVLKDRIHTIGEVHEIIDRKELDYLITPPTLTKAALLWSKKPDIESAWRHLLHIYEVLDHKDEELDPQTIKDGILAYAETQGKGEVLWPLRLALSGQERSIDPFNLLSILGKTESQKRIQSAISLLK